MAGPTPTVKLPQGVPYREVTPDPSLLWEALSSGADQGNDPTSQAIAASIPQRRTEDIELEGMPAPPDAPEMFRTPSAAMSGLSKAADSSLPPEIAERMKIRAGFSGGANDPGVDWAAERAGFLGQGNADREAMEADEQRQARGSVFPGGRTGSDTLRDDLAFRSLQRARDMTDPRYAREQRQQDTLADADTYSDPRMGAFRGAKRQDALTDRASLNELQMMFANDPRALAAEQRGFGQKKTLAEIDARGHMGAFGAMMGGENSAAPRGTASMQDVQDYASAHGITAEQALAAFKAEGYAVSQ